MLKQRYTWSFEMIVGVLTTCHMLEYVVAPMELEILKVFFYDVRCAAVMHFSAWSAVN